MANTTFKIEAGFKSNAISVRMDGISIKLNPSTLIDNIDTIGFIVHSITSKLKIEYNYEVIAEENEALKGVLALAQEYLKDSDVWISFQIDHNGQISSEIDGKVNYNIINMISKINELFN